MSIKKIDFGERKNTTRIITIHIYTACTHQIAKVASLTAVTLGGHASLNRLKNTEHTHTHTYTLHTHVRSPKLPRSPRSPWEGMTTKNRSK
jgi:hypothetical protein